MDDRARGDETSEEFQRNSRVQDFGTGRVAGSWPATCEGDSAFINQLLVNLWSGDQQVPKQSDFKEFPPGLNR